jgi:hypothetical protein
VVELDEISPPHLYFPKKRPMYHLKAGLIFTRLQYGYYIAKTLTRAFF